MKEMRSLIIALLLVFAVPGISQEQAVTEQGPEIQWISIEKAEELSKDEPRKVIVDVYTDWCGWCKRMDKTTFSNPVIIEYINQNYYAVKLDAEQKENITFKDHEFKYVAQGRRGYHELAAALLNGKMSYPNIVYLNEEMKIIQAVPGYQNTQNMELIIKFFGEDAYLDQPFDDYQANFVSDH